MVVKIDKDDKLFIDNIEYEIKSIDSKLLKNIFMKALKKEASIEVENEENCGYLGRLFLEIKNCTAGDSDFYKKYNELKETYHEINGDTNQEE